MNTQNNQVVNEQYTEQVERSEQPLPSVAEKKQFVEPTVSVPVDVLEATTFFQAPTIEASSV
ncbi:MAG: hypothetical protein DMF64_02145 [Acidobacteria bacterium]|nr:MAG: hypothetical protein DMF64_02145 [Acidobacteriota bacterium]